MCCWRRRRRKKRRKNRRRKRERRKRRRKKRKRGSRRGNHEITDKQSYSGRVLTWMEWEAHLKRRHFSSELKDKKEPMQGDAQAP